MKLRKTNRGLVRLGVATGTVTGMLVGSFAITPFTMAENGNPATTELTVSLEPVISLEIDDTAVALDLDTAVNNGFGSASTGVLVSTNASDGYTLYITSDSSETALTHNNPEVSSQIQTLSSPTDEANFPSNNWGYYDLVNSRYAGIPAVGATTAIVNQTSTPEWAMTEEEIENAKFDLTIGAKANLDLDSGTYSNTVVLTALTN